MYNDLTNTYKRFSGILNKDNSMPNSLFLKNRRGLDKSSNSEGSSAIRIVTKNTGKDWFTLN